MDYLDLTLSLAAENLALDEALLDGCEFDEGPETLRVWEPRDRFVVLGYSNQRDREVFVDRCREQNVPIFRRCSGGGTVLQMSGVLNYNLVLRIPESGPLSNVSGTNTWVMRRMKQALSLLPGLGGRLAVQGITDLCLDGRKFMGNAQRRKRRALVFHGSFLIQAELSLLGEFLQMPSIQPDYREQRSHSDFCCNLGASIQEVKECLRQQWGAEGVLEEWPKERCQQLVRDRYSQQEWNEKF